MARAFGSYPECRRFKSTYRYQLRPGGQAVKTPPFHGGNTGSIPVRVTKRRKHSIRSAFSFVSPDAESNPWARASRKQSCGLFLARGAAAAARSGFRKAKSTSIPVRATKNTHCFSLNYRTLTAFQRNCKHPRQTF